MENVRMFPFERNRYYAGKLLTSADFEAEQDYMNHKRSFVNSLLLGQGILCGLGVFNLDDLSIMIESGAAVDSLGREIVIENSIVKKLSAIDGFDGLTSSKAALCLRYREEEVHPVYSVGRQERNQEYECNRIREEYQLFLVDSSSVPKTYRMETEFYSSARLYGGDSYTVEVSMPYIVSCGKKVKLALKVVRQDADGPDIEVDVTLAMPAFTVGGKHELEIHTGKIHLEKGEVFTSEYWLTAQNEESESTSIIIGKGGAAILSGQERLDIRSDFNLRTSIQDISPKELVTREIGKISLEMRQMGQNMDFVPLTEFILVRTDNAYMIDRVDDSRIKRYIPLPSGEALRSEYSACFGEADVGSEPENSDSLPQKEESFVRHYADPLYAAGSCEIPLGANARKGLIQYSGEIVHGLGCGDVFVQLGIDYLEEDISLNREARHTVYGNARLFADKGKTPVPSVETAVKVFHDKGSFVAAVKLLEDCRTAVLGLHWTAVKFPSGNGLDETGQTAGMGIAAETPTVVLEPGGSCFFHVQFKNMRPCSLVYQLTEEGGGEISKEGIYTAPAKEGVYEIYISCLELPAVGTYAYAVVKRQE